MATQLKRVAPRERITATQYNALVDAINALQKVRYGSGLRYRFTAAGGVVTLDDSILDDLVPARITAAPSGTSVPESDCRYTIRAITNNDWVLDGVRPRYNRPFRGDDVNMIPAKVGDYCYMVRAFAGLGKFDADAWVPTEAYVTARCDPSPGSPSLLGTFNTIIPVARTAPSFMSAGSGDATQVASE